MGFSGSGKTSLLRRLEKSDNKPCRFFDLDGEVEKRLGASIEDLVTKWGWEEFRRIEREELDNLISIPGPKLIALGGGALELNTDFMQRVDVFTVHIDTPFEECWQRIAHDNQRPLVREGKIFMQKLFNSRKPLYLRADAIIKPNMIDRILRVEDLFEHKS